MPTAISLPSCLMDCYKVLYPKLDFSRVAFYSGLPSFVSLGEPDGFTMASGAASPDIRMYIKDYEPCGKDPLGKETFLLIAHELVHVVQIFRACSAAAASLARGWRTTRRRFSIARGDGGRAPTCWRKRPTPSPTARSPSGAAPSARCAASWTQRSPHAPLRLQQGAVAGRQLHRWEDLRPSAARRRSLQDHERRRTELVLALFWPLSLIAGAFSIFGFSNLGGAIGAGGGRRPWRDRRGIFRRRVRLYPGRPLGRRDRRVPRRAAWRAPRSADRRGDRMGDQ